MINPFKAVLSFFVKRHTEKFPISYQVDSLRYSQGLKGLIPFIDVMGKTRQKTKFLLQRSNDKIIYFLYTVLILGSCKILTDGETKQYLIKLFEDKKDSDLNKKKFSSSNLIIQEVLLKEQINQQLGRLITQVCQKPSSQHNVTKQLNKLYTMSILQKKTYEITTKVLRNNLFYKDDIDEKLKQLIIRQLWYQQQRIVSMLSSVILSQSLQESSNQGFIGLISSDTVKQVMANNIAGTINSFIEDDQTKQNVLQNFKSIMK